MAQQPDHLHWLRVFASLQWYEETIRFVFTFVTKTSELLLAAGIVISTANFLTDGDVMNHHKALSDAWAWAQALAIDSSLGIVFMNAFQSLRERDKVKAIIFFTLTALLATVAGLITHFDALGHAAGLPVTDKGVSGIIPLWVMTALRAVTVIGFLLASRLKEVSFQELRQQEKPDGLLSQEQRQEQTVPQIDYSILASVLVGAMKQAEVVSRVSVVEEKITLPSPATVTTHTAKAELVNTTMQTILQGEGQQLQCDSVKDEPTEARIAEAYEATRMERTASGNDKPISARDLALRAKVRRSTCSDWLKQHVTDQGGMSIVQANWIR